MIVAALHDVDKPDVPPAIRGAVWLELARAELLAGKRDTDMTSRFSVSDLATWTDKHVGKVASRLLRPKPPLFGADVTLSPRTGRGFLVGSVCRECRGEGSVGGYDSDHVWEDKAWTCAACASTGIEEPRVEPRPHADDFSGLARVGSLLDQAERYARLAVERLAPWGGPAPDRVTWRVGGRPRGPRQDHAGLEILYGWLRVACDDQLSDRDPPALVKLLGNGIAGSSELYDDALLAWRYHEASTRGMSVPTRYVKWGNAVDLSAHPLAARKLVDLPNPLEPWLEIWSLGFALDTITREHVLIHRPRL